jgi:hypothetical protein
VAIYYLDVDDEITSAATRIRDSSDNRIALVLTGGSRVATSRINFILLAREARKRSKRLAIVTSDTSTQSVARSADLPVFGSVGEYERAEAARARGASPEHAGDTDEALDELAMTLAPARSRPPAGAPSRMLTGLDFHMPEIRVGRGVLAAVAIAALLIVGAGGFFLYPSAKVVLTLREDAVGPLPLSVTVDPSALSADDTTATVPGLDKAFPVQASGTFAATGENVTETAATGTVTFTNNNNFLAVPVLAGTRVTTAAGVAFVTDSSITVPKATVSGTTLTPGRADVGVAAVEKGTAGNVAAGTIDRMPADLAASMVDGSVANAQPTSGGTHTVTAAIVQADIDNAASSLLDQLNSAFQTAMTGPGAVPNGSSLFPQTAHLGVAVCNPDPAGLVGKEQDSFDLTCKATGTATVADMTAVRQLAERKISSSVKSGYSLVTGSVSTQLGSAAIQNGSIVVPVTARAAEVAVVDVNSLRAAIVDKPVDEAKAYLERFGAVDISLSPGWAGKMPAYDFRIDLQLVVPVSSPSPSASASASAAATPTQPPVTVKLPEAAPQRTEAPTELPSDQPVTASPAPTPIPSQS